MPIKISITGQVCLLLIASVTGALSALQEGRSKQQPDKELRLEEETDYYRKWLKEDVVYIISPEEREVFEKLTTREEKDRFIEQFWQRRDGDLTTAENEYKEEHYRRIAYANEHFYSGESGWMTDRGRVYIIHGPPDQIERHPAGGSYNRPMHEGGGSTATFPFEIWWYRKIEGIGSDIELEFVDRTNSNQYRLALRPEDKDALLYVAGAGETLAEELGIARKEDRPFFSPENKGLYPMIHNRAKDDPFVRYETYSLVHRPKDIKYRDLQASVKVDLSFNNLPFQVREDYFELNDNQVLVPITVELQNKDLSFLENGNTYVANLAIYGIVTSLQQNVVSEFEDEVTTVLDAQSFARGVRGRSMYQKIVSLDKKMRYKVDLAIKDLNSGNLGALSQALLPPAFGDEFVSSSLILTDFLEVLQSIPTADKMFVLGDIWLRPSLSKVFSLDSSLAVYLQVYNFAVDQASMNPSIEATYRVYRGAKPVLEISDQNAESIQFVSGRRVVLIKHLPITLLQPGRYRVEVQVIDRVKNGEIKVSEEFEIGEGSG